MKTSHLTQDSFDSLLRWLDPDRERAGERYEGIRVSLIKFFAYRGADSPEELADETINRVASKLPSIVESYEGEPAYYFYAVAKRIFLEYSRRPSELALPLTPFLAQQDEEHEDIHNCLDQCLQQLPPNQRELLLNYYNRPPNRKEISEKLGIEYNALRVRIHRLRHHLVKCIERCLEQKVP